MPQALCPPCDLSPSATSPRRNTRSGEQCLPPWPSGLRRIAPDRSRADRRRHRSRATLWRASSPSSAPSPSPALRLRTSRRLFESCISSSHETDDFRAGNRIGSTATVCLCRQTCCLPSATSLLKLVDVLFRVPTARPLLAAANVDIRELAVLDECGKLINGDIEPARGFGRRQ